MKLITFKTSEHLIVYQSTHVHFQGMATSIIAPQSIG